MTPKTHKRALQTLVSPLHGPPWVSGLLGFRVYSGRQVFEVASEGGRGLFVVSNFGEFVK